VNSGAYDNSKFHRSVSDFVIQGGGFKAPTVAADQPGSDPVAIPTTGTVQNEPPSQTSNFNNRGTIAMAKLGGQPDSATSQFFFNLSDNSFLDSDNGGYTQFGSVLGSGMTVVDTIGSALTYDATTYYSNTALSDLPLWNVNQDNIVRPQDFVQIENADVVTESALFTYQVSSSDSAKLTASFDGNGNLLLTPVGDASGSVDVTVTATSKLDNNETASDTFSVQLNGDGGPVTPVLTAIESAGNTILNKDQDGKLYAGDQPLYMSGTTQLTETYFAAYTPVAVEDFGDGDKRFVLKHSTGSLLTFSMSTTWTRTGNLPWIETNDPTGFNAAELEYGVDFDDDGNTGLIFTPIETAGSTALRRDQSGRLYAGSQPIYLSGTTQLTETYFATYTPVAVEDFGDGDKRFVLKHSTGSLLTFTMSSTWTRTGNLPWIEVDDPAAFNAAEAEYGLDFDGDA
jgi:cyclophilin family peptidyl-prolyl cis-trans isomerase/DNA-directed RNA polymerase subunit H (RpoH/RPB5)